MAEDKPSKSRPHQEAADDAEPSDDIAPKKKRKRQRKAEELRLTLEQMSAEDRSKLAREAFITGCSSRDVGFSDRKVSLGELIQEVQTEQAQLGSSAGATYDTVRHGVEQVPGQYLRPGAPKMALRPEEEAELALDLLGNGAVWSPRPLFGYALGGIRDAGFGVYAKCSHLKAVLEDRWAGEDPDKALVNDDFYDEIINTAPLTELTMMAAPSRNISLPVIREQLEHRMKEALAQRWPGGVPPESLDTLSRIGDAIDGRHLGSTGIVKGNDLLADTNVIVSATQDGAFTVEAITPTKELKDRKTVFLCRCADKHLTHALFSLVLGPKPVCEEAKITVGYGALYITNGFKFGPNPENPNQVLMRNGEDIDRPPSMEPSFQELLQDKQADPIASSFQLTEEDESSGKPLLHHIRHGLKRQKKNRERAHS